jgi:hypothetical protein
VRALRLFRFGLAATRTHFGLAFAVCLLFGGVSGLASGLLYSQEHAITLWANQDQMKSMLALFGLDILLQLLTTLLLGPIFQAAAAFAAFRHSRGKPGTAHLGLNFALSRYGRMFKPHAQAWLLILVGIQLFLIPGIIYWNQFALVDAVTVFVQAAAPAESTAHHGLPPHHLHDGLSLACVRHPGAGDCAGACGHFPLAHDSPPGADWLLPVRHLRGVRAAVPGTDRAARRGTCR